MNTTRFTRTGLLLAVAASLLALPAQQATAQTATDDIEVLRSVLKTDRKVVIAEGMQFTEAEGNAFWPLYRDYRAGMDKLGDGIVKLVREYAAAYPNVPEDRAATLLKDYQALEKDLVNERAKHLKKFAKVLPKSKVLRFAQLENRLDLALRLQMASAVPLVPVEGRMTGDAATGTASYTEGVPGGVIVQTYEVSATVAAIDKASRKLTLVSPEGIKKTVKAGPEVANFDQIRVGDQLKVTATAETVVRMAESGAPGNDGAAAVVALAPKGAKPGALLAETRQVTARVTEINAKNRTATLRFEDGSTQTFPVRSDIDLAKRKVGEQVVLRVTEALAIRVEKP
jgi:hypothetical protein